MATLRDPRRGPTAVLFAVLLVVVIAVMRIPESLVAELARHRRLSSGEAGWAYRLLVLAAVAQAAYGGFVVLRPERVRKARTSDERVAAMSRERVLVSVARNSAGMCFLTLVYGLAALGLTVQRGGFWLFVGLILAQAAWYYRQVGAIAAWMEFQPEAASDEQAAPSLLNPLDFAPSIARGLTPVELWKPQPRPG